MSAAHKRINSFFAKTASDPERLKTFKMNLVNQICEATGGPCKYTGKDMKSAKNELLGALGPMKADIVEKR